MLKPGINNNVFLVKTEIQKIKTGDKNMFALIFSNSKEEKEQKKVNSDDIALSLLSNDEAITGDGNKSDAIYIFQFGLPMELNFKNTPKTKDEKLREINNLIGNTKNIFIQFLSLYLKKEDIKFDLLRGTNITPQTFSESLLSEEYLKMYFFNLCDQFSKQMAPYLSKDPLRLLLVRQSKEKHFPTFRKRYVSSANPIVELMSVPEDQSMLKFSDYEIKEGLHLDTIVKPDVFTLPEDPMTSLKSSDLPF